MSSGASPLDDADAHMSAAQDPSMAFFDKMASIQQSAEDNMKNDANIDHLEKMVSTEENYFAFILLKCLQLCPSIFGNFIMGNVNSQNILVKMNEYTCKFRFLCRKTTNSRRNREKSEQGNAKSLDTNWSYFGTCRLMVV